MLQIYIVNKLSVSFFIITKVAKKNSRVVVQDKTRHAKISTDQLQYLKKFT